jgi:hypothetical protein
MSWGSADLMPTSRPLRSEQALGSVVPSPYPPPRLAAHINTRGLLNQGEVTSKTHLVSSPLQPSRCTGRVPPPALILPSRELLLGAFSFSILLAVR